MPLPPISYRLSREHLEAESPAYTRLILDAGRKEPQANIAWRRHIRELCRENVDARVLVMELCRREPLFFANTFCCVEEPRKGQQSIVYPFVTYEFQDAFLLDIFTCIGVSHHQTVKSRDTGWSFMVMGIVLPHQFCFAHGPKYTIASSDKEMVESTQNPDTLMAKFDFNMSRFPWWMRGDYDATNPKHKQLFNRWNPTTDVVVSGAATKADIGRGGRRTAIFCDEAAMWTLADGIEMLAAMVPATDSIIMGSTPKGDIGVFRDRWHDEDSPAFRVELKWEDHPRYREGMYRSEQGKLEIIDDAFWDSPGSRVTRLVKNRRVAFTQSDYPFILDGLLRSPLYDLCELNLGSRPMMAQEYDRDFLGSGQPFFDTGLIRRLTAEHGTEPICRVSLEIDFETGELLNWKEAEDGILWLWRRPQVGIGWPADDRFYLGCDVASGSGGSYASNATIEIFDSVTGEQVGELASASIDPSDLASYAAALGHWFNRAIIAFEKDGHGLQFLKRIFRKLAYPNLYRPKQAEKEAGTKLARSPGWAPRPETKLDAFKEFRAAQAEGHVLIHSKRFYEEQHQFVHDGAKGVCHRKALIVEDRSAGRHKHGDRVSGGVIAWKCREEFPTTAKKDAPKVAKPGTLQYLLNQHDKEQKRGNSGFCPSGVTYASRIGRRSHE